MKRKQIGYIGLGKMGKNMVSRLKKQGWQVHTYDLNGTGSKKTVEQLIASLEKPRTVWIMVPAGKPVDDILSQSVELLEKGDIFIDGGNSFYEESIRRALSLKAKGIHFLDVGVSGGPGTVRDGRPALMIGGEKRVFEKARPLFQDLTGKDSIGYMGKAGAGHFVKMVHNGIEYGLMQSLAEGFAILKKSPFGIRLGEASRVYSNGSVIESRLTKWLQDGFQKFGEELKGVSGTVDHTGEGAWTVQTAKKLGVPVPAIQSAVRVRMQSAKNPNYTGKVLMMLRNQFGGHSVQNKK